MLGVLLILPISSSSALGIPETAITRTHLMKDIEESSVTIGVGTEWLKEEPEPAYNADFLYVYLGYSPLDFLEFGIALHSIWLDFYYLGEAKIDLVDIFTDQKRVSCILMGGAGGRWVEGSFDLLYHGGVAVNYRVDDRMQLYFGAGSDSDSAALNLQAGIYAVALKWLGISFNAKLVTGPKGTEPMISIAPLAVF
jgi:hypothetical protein